MSETMGGGDLIDKAMLGEDAETNEYGQLVGAASQVGGAMSSKKIADAAMKLDRQNLRERNIENRLAAINPVAAAKYAIERGGRDTSNLDALQKHEGGFMGLLDRDIKGLDFSQTKTGAWDTIAPPDSSSVEVDKGFLSKYEYEPRPPYPVSRF